MKNASFLRVLRSRPRQPLGAGLLLAGTLLLASTNARAYTNTFDTAASLNGWAHWWGAAMETRAFDPAVDADNNPSSGSMRVTVPFNRSHGGDNQFSMWGSFSGTPNSWTQRLNGAQYLSLEMDIFWDPFAPTIPATGNFGSDFTYGFAVGDPVYGQIPFVNHTVITPADAGHWIHLSAAIDPDAIGPNITNIVGIWIKMWTGNDPNNSLQDGEATFWVDNIELIPVPPPTPDYVNNFDTAESLNGWAHWWGMATETREFDPAMDAGGDPNSGSMKVSVPYDRSFGGDNQFSMWGSFSGSPNSWGAPLNGTLYTNLEMDVYWDPGSPTRPSTGDYGNDFRYGFAVGQPIYGQISFNNHTTIAAADVGRWIHLSAPIDLATVGANITNIVGVWIKMWTGADANNSLQTGTAIFWVDNILLSAKSPDAPEPEPPTMEIEKASPAGLRLFASAAGSQYQRQSIRTVNADYSWVGALEPVTYSLTISAHPGVAGFQTHIFLVPGSGVPATQSAADYTEPNLVFLDIQQNAAGTAFGAFRYKTNEPNGNAFLYDVNRGSMVTLGAPTVLGTWSLTFNPSGEIALAAPGGAVTNFTLPAETVSLFSGPLFAYFGIQPNQPVNIGLSGTLGRVQISGVGTPIDETFALPVLDASLWQVVAESPVGVIPVPPEALFWLYWTLPDNGFGLQTAFRLSGPWSDLDLPSPQIGNRKRVLVLPDNLPASATGNYFFQLFKP